jgi:hypothetical protein
VTPRLWLASALVAVAGCGASEEGAVKAVAGAYTQAFADGDYKRACSLTTAPGRDCEQALRALHDGSVRNTKVKSVSIDGDRATAALEGGSFPVPLEKRDGRWLVTIAQG